MLPRPNALLVCVAASALLALSQPAQCAEVSAAQKKEAAALFKKGEVAFKKNDFAGAATAFEAANDIAPHPAALFNAARAYERAGELAQAANLCARYLRDAPEGDKRRGKAMGMLAELRPKLGRITVIAVDADDITLDGAALALEETYVNPGDHQVAGRFGNRMARRKVNVVAGSLERVTLEPKKVVPAATLDQGEEVAPESDAPKDVAAPESSGFSPALFYVGLGATAVLAGATVWSGLDTNSAREDFDKNPSRDALDEGESKQSRTNLLLGTTAVVGVATGVIGAFFTDFSGKKAPKEPVDDEVSLGVRLAPGYVSLSGKF
jgi:hypothetical protein